MGGLRVVAALGCVGAAVGPLALRTKVDQMLNNGDGAVQLWSLFSLFIFAFYAFWCLLSSLLLNQFLSSPPGSGQRKLTFNQSVFNRHAVSSLCIISFLVCRD